MIDLPQIWFVLIGVLLVGYAVLDGFDLGVGMLSPILGRTSAQRGLLVETIGPVWDGNEVWLLALGGALFAAFPIVYATVFSGFYLALMLLLFALILRAVSIEFRNHVEDARWLRFWDGAFWLGSFLPALLLGVAIGNIARGLPLTGGEYTQGLLGLLNPFSLGVGLLAVAMFAMQGASWLVLRTEGELAASARRVGRLAWVCFVVLWLVVTALALIDAPDLWANYGNLLAWLAPLVFVAALAVTGYALWSRHERLPILGSSLSIAALVAILGQALYPALVPDRTAGADLTITNAAASNLSLSVMLVITLIGVPIVLVYTGFVYSRFTHKVSLEEPAS
ncbi:MAG TPA: cytochrome d ubiquinol oxidase subunit II [Candidatus Limnocylindrales bacterium]